MAYNQYKVLEAFQRNNIRDMHFSWNTGYGYDDPGRDAVERVYADIFHTEAALVRPTIVNGTHALTLTLMGILRPGDEMIYCTGCSLRYAGGSHRSSRRRQGLAEGIRDLL